VDAMTTTWQRSRRLLGILPRRGYGQSLAIVLESARTVNGLPPDRQGEITAKESREIRCFLRHTATIRQVEWESPDASAFHSTNPSDFPARDSWLLAAYTRGLRVIQRCHYPVRFASGPCFGG
jgi:hypothetical protein